MGLYQIINAEPLNQAIQPIPQGTLLNIPLVVPVGGALRCILMQLSPTQDFSMRAWVSLYPDGIPLGKALAGDYWAVNRTPGVFTVYDQGLSPPEGQAMNIPLEPGNYILNILNLVNSENTLAYSVSPV